MNEAYTSIKNMIRFYGKIENDEIVRKGAQMPFNLALISNTNITSNACNFKGFITDWLDNMPHNNSIHANWVVS